MKKWLIILIVSMQTSGVLFSQDTKNSTGSNFIYPQFHENFTAEESWQIHKEAYKKQLKADGLNDLEIEKKITDYEKDKKLFIEKIHKQMEQAAIQRKEAEVMREKAAEQRKEAEILREKAEQTRKEAEAQRQQADVMRKQAEESRKVNAVEREKAEEIRKQAMVQREQAEKLREEAAVQRKKAEAMRLEAEVQRKKAEEWRNSFENILSKRIDVSSSSTAIDPILIKLDKKESLVFSIHGKLSTGNILVEIINPKGEKEGELSLEHNQKSGAPLDDNFLKYTTGSIHKIIADAEAGNWEIRIAPKKSEGNVSISVARYSKPASNE